MSSVLKNVILILHYLRSVGKDYWMHEKKRKTEQREHESQFGKINKTK
jgi:hypothetical protein